MAKLGNVDNIYHTNSMYDKLHDIFIFTSMDGWFLMVKYMVNVHFFLMCISWKTNDIFYGLTNLP